MMSGEGVGVDTWIWIAMPVAAIVVAWTGWAVYRRVVAYRRLNATLQRLGAHAGIVGRPRLSGDNRFNGPFVVGLSAIRPGTPESVAEELTRSARSLGYRTSNVRPPCPANAPCLFRPVNGLPSVAFRTFGPGAPLPGTELEVPARHCGVVISAY
ncbi:hypothetical protein [Actinokineospora sp. HUAS TT18]|uniref:hypothetical protein n=1 Tax=Actinokineospora sp. HUAS TT18 TaxID=3447451 RepID=UPI003F51D379